MKAGPGSLRIGTSGYQYDHWKQVFYPELIPKSRWFEYYVRHFDTVEINNTFYRLPTASTFDAWYRQAPRDFCYALKFSRYGTHLKRLKDPQQTIANFLARADRLKESLGPILVQLPPRWNVNPERLAEFLETAPADHRWAVEFRDPSWLCEQSYAILAGHNAALCIHDWIDDHPYKITADWIYLRFHGNRDGGCYCPQFLNAEAQRIREYLHKGLDVFAYFNNDLHGFAVRNAADLKRYLSKQSQ